jgi:hypothetical protein
LARNLRLDFEHIPTTSGYTSALWPERWYHYFINDLDDLLSRILWWREFVLSLESLLSERF